MLAYAFYDAKLTVTFLGACRIDSDFLRKIIFLIQENVKLKWEFCFLRRNFSRQIVS